MIGTVKGGVCTCSVGCDWSVVTVGEFKFAHTPRTPVSTAGVTVTGMRADDNTGEVRGEEAGT